MKERGRRALEEAALLDRCNVALRLRLAMLAEDERRAATAMDCYEAILGIEPGNALAANNLAAHLTTDPAMVIRAVDLARDAVAARPEFGEFHDTLAQALAAAGHTAEAAEEAGKAFDLAPKRAGIALRAAFLFRDAGNTVRAREAAERALALAPPEQEADVRKKLGDLLR